MRTTVWSGHRPPVHHPRHHFFATHHTPPASKTLVAPLPHPETALLRTGVTIEVPCTEGHSPHWSAPGFAVARYVRQRTRCPLRPMSAHRNRSAARARHRLGPRQAGTRRRHHPRWMLWGQLPVIFISADRAGPVPPPTRRHVEETASIHLGMLAAHLGAALVWACGYAAARPQHSGLPPTAHPACMFQIGAAPPAAPCPPWADSTDNGAVPAPARCRSTRSADADHPSRLS